MYKWSTIAGIVLFVWACSAEAPEEKQEKDDIVVVNGVERSELALAMRDMYDRMKLVSDSIKVGHEVHANFLSLFRNIQTAKATTPSKIDASYHGMADMFLASYAAFENDRENQAETFNAMIESCLGCHSQKCTGPMKTIGKLKVNPI